MHYWQQVGLYFEGKFRQWWSNLLLKLLTVEAVTTSSGKVFHGATTLLEKNLLRILPALTISILWTFPLVDVFLVGGEVRL